MFRDLDDTLRVLLEQAPATLDVLEGADISFVLPDRNFAPTESRALNLFLYDVHENRELRDPVPIIEEVGGFFMRRRPPLRVDCSYMVTAWSNNMNPQPRAAEEHRLLSQALLWLGRFPIIPDAALQGSLIHPPFPHRTEVALPNGNKSMGEFWTALGQPPRPSFNLQVTLAMELSVAELEGPPVITKEMRLMQKGRPDTQEQWFQIGGTVSGAGSLPGPIGGAEVLLVEKNQTAITDELGHFTFTLLPADQYTLQVSAGGFQPASLNIVVPAPPGSPPGANAYDVILTPL